MGVYVMEPSALDFIEVGQPLDLPDLVLRLLDAGEQVGTHLFEGYWLDIGRHEDYERAIIEYESLKAELHPGPAPGSPPGRRPSREARPGRCPQ